MNREPLTNEEIADKLNDYWDSVDTPAHERRRVLENLQLLTSPIPVKFKLCKTSHFPVGVLHDLARVECEEIYAAGA